MKDINPIIRDKYKCFGDYLDSFKDHLIRKYNIDIDRTDIDTRGVQSIDVIPMDGVIRYYLDDDWCFRVCFVNNTDDKQYHIYERFIGDD